MQQYLDLLHKVLHTGKKRNDRTGTGTIGLFGSQLRFDLSTFPIVTTKKVHMKSVIHELLWFLQGNTNIKYLTDNGVRIWNEWADENGDLGPVYGKQWRSWQGADGKTHDQIKWLINELKTNPSSRRLIINAWNVGELEKMALPPCHCMFQFYCQNGALSCQLYQRSADLFLGVPFNISSYALLTMMIASSLGLKPGEFVHTFGDVHIYNNHIEQVETQLSRRPLPLPTMEINPEIKDLFAYKYEDLKLVNYQSHAKLTAPVAV